MTDQQTHGRALVPFAVILLAAGKGTRMNSDLPKAMHPIAGQPMIRHVLGTVEALSPARIVVVIGPEMEKVAETVAPHTIVVQTERLGTGHAVIQARSALSDFKGDIVVLCADTPLITADTITELLSARANTALSSVAVLGFRLKDPTGYGRLRCGADGGLEEIIEDEDATEGERQINLCNSGIMSFDGSSLFDLLDKIENNNSKGEYYLTDIVSYARASGKRCTVFEADADELHGVNSRFDLARAEKMMQKRLRLRALVNGVTLRDPSTTWMCIDTRIGRDVTIEPNVFFGPGVDIGDGVEIRAFSHLEGVRIKAGARIGPFARLRPGTVIGEGARVGNFVEIKSADVGAGAKINHLTYIGDARVGEGANIGAGTITCNYDGFSKHHTDVGAGAFIGSNTALVAPVSVGDRAIVGAGSVITEDVEDDALGVTRAAQKIVKGGATRWRNRRSPDRT